MTALLIGGKFDGAMLPVDNRLSIHIDNILYRRDWIWSTAHGKLFYFYMYAHAKPPLAKDVLQRLIDAGIAFPVEQHVW